MPDKTPDSFLGWLGRQVGFVKKAIKTDVKHPRKVVYRADNVEEVPHPEQPNMTLRRTTIDEVIVQKDKPQMNADERRSD
ncbi:MAG: hypothetical protein WBD40_14245 [Tepidisphaeraceae bacterium]